MIEKKIEILKQYYNGKELNLFLSALLIVEGKILSHIECFKDQINDLVHKRLLVRNTDNNLITFNESLFGTEVEDRIQEYRDLWHFTNTGIKGKMGNKQNCISHAKKFINENNLTFDELLKLSKYYVDNYVDISGFIQQADYFLYKEKLILGKRVTTSRAASLLDEYKEFVLEQTEMI